MEELTDLKEVWSELSKVWEGIEHMKEQPWLSINPRKLRQSLDGYLEQMKNFPARLRQYQSYEYIMKSIKSYMKVNVVSEYFNLKQSFFLSCKNTQISSDYSHIKL